MDAERVLVGKLEEQMLTVAVGPLEPQADECFDRWLEALDQRKLADCDAFDLTPRQTLIEQLTKGFQLRELRQPRPRLSQAPATHVSRIRPACRGW